MDNGVKINAGNFEVYSCGNVISYDESPVEFKISGLTFIFEFVQNQEIHEAATLATNNAEKNTLTFTCSNYDSSLPIGNTEPIYVGLINKRQLYLNFRISKLDMSKSRTIQYTWYLSK